MYFCSSLFPQTVYWPSCGHKGFHLEVLHAGDTPNGYYYSSNRFEAYEHGGTHLDAPVHFAKGHSTVDQIELHRLIGRAVVVDVSDCCLSDRDRNHRISISDIVAFEQRHGVIPPHSIVLLKTGFGGFWPSREKYLGTAEIGESAVQKLSFPGLHADAANWLLAERKIKAVGLDTASIDCGSSTHFEAHRVLLGNEIPVFENVANLNLLSPSHGWTVFALPMKIKGGTGAPLRLIAIRSSDLVNL